MLARVAASTGACFIALVLVLLPLTDAGAGSARNADRDGRHYVVTVEGLTEALDLEADSARVAGDWARTAASDPKGRRQEARVARADHRTCGMNDSGADADMAMEQRFLRLMRSR